MVPSDDNTEAEIREQMRILEQRSEMLGQEITRIQLDPEPDPDELRDLIQEQFETDEKWQRLSATQYPTD